jgi:hypothetical protein
VRSTAGTGEGAEPAAAVRLVAAFVLALAPGVASRLAGPAWGLDALPWTPLALLPWLVLAGLPGRPSGIPSVAAVLAALLPALGLTLASDLGAGARPAAALEVAGWGALLCAVLAFASRRGGPVYAGLWWLTVPVAALLLAARSLVGGLSAEGGWTGVLAASPLAWPWRALEALRPASGEPVGAPLGPLAVAALLVIAGGAGRRKQAAQAGGDEG